jgi:hypothetical protein
VSDLIHEAVAQNMPNQPSVAATLPRALQPFDFERADGEAIEMGAAGEKVADRQAAIAQRLAMTLYGPMRSSTPCPTVLKTSIMTWSAFWPGPMAKRTTQGSVGASSEG